MDPEPTRKRQRKDTRVKDALLTDAVDVFFDNLSHWEQMIAVLNEKGRNGGVSLRVLDFLCTVFAYEQPCTVTTADNSRCTLLEVYETSLSAYGKSHYDCFRRTARLCLEKHGGKISTTLGQLLFFKDIIQNGILAFAKEHIADIKDAMNATKHEKKGKQARGKARSRKHLDPQQLGLDSVSPLLFSR